MKDTQKSATRTTRTDETSEVWTDDEKAAMRERAKEMKAASRKGAAELPTCVVKQVTRPVRNREAPVTEPQLE